MGKPLYQLCDELPARNVTTRVLHALDWVVPGQWNNVVGYENLIRDVTGETDERMIQRVGERATKLFADKNEGYQSAVWLYQTVDWTQGVAGTASLLSKLGETFSFLSFMNRLTPKADTTQAIDLAIKLGTEVVCFCKINGIPGDSVGDFVESLSNFKEDAAMRMGALVCLDGLIPLGPDFMSKAFAVLQTQGLTSVVGNQRFQQLSGMLPGQSTQETLGFLEETLAQVRTWANGFVKKNHLTVGTVVDHLKKYVDGVEGNLDYIASFTDMTVNYFEHTGVQTVARSVIARAHAEV